MDKENLQCGHERKDDEFKVIDKVTWTKQLYVSIKDTRFIKENLRTLHWDKCEESLRIMVALHSQFQG